MPARGPVCSGNQGELGRHGIYEIDVKHRERYMIVALAMGR